MQYPELFPKKIIDFGLFLNVYGLVYTRCFGSGLPSISLIPMADNFNHDFLYVSFQFINLMYQKNYENVENYFRSNKFMNDYSSIYSESEINSMNLKELQNVKGLFINEIFQIN